MFLVWYLAALACAQAVSTVAVGGALMAAEDKKFVRFPRGRSLSGPDMKTQF